MGRDLQEEYFNPSMGDDTCAQDMTCGDWWERRLNTLGVTSIHSQTGPKQKCHSRESIPVGDQHSLT